VRFYLRGFRINRGAWLGVLVGLISFGVRFMVLKPNRLAGGTFFYTWEVLSAGLVAVLAVPWFLLLFLGIKRHTERFSETAGALVGVFAIVLVFVLWARAAANLLESEPRIARASMGFGSLGMILGAYIAASSSLRHESVSGIWKNLIPLFGLAVLAVLFISGFMSDLSVMKEFAVRKGRFLQEFGRHVVLCGFSVAAAVVIGIPLGLWAFRKSLFEKPIFFVVNTIQTVPSLALFGLMIAPLSILSHRFPLLRELGIKGVGTAPALIALCLYALLPITRNTYTSLKVLDPSVIEAAKGMGMGKLQMLMSVQIPLSLPIILSGIRISTVQAIGNTTVAALIGAGGFGVFVFQGLGQAVPDLILLGAVPVILLAIFTDKLMALLIRIITPEGIARQKTVSRR
jgi:osmoprotectant transport system permease protein